MVKVRKPTLSAIAEDTAHELPASRRHIIERPRLTRLLDEAEAAARAVALVAPAGYGKTTLAQQWLENRRHVWCRASSASRDVAALAAGVAHAMSEVKPRVGHRMLERLRVSQDPESDVEVLARLLIEDLVDWRSDVWLAIDDYHHVAETEATETFIGAIAASGHVRLLVTSRLRPRWATARRLLYGEVLEVSAASLALTPDEADSVLSHRQVGHASGLVALADGWPAVIGLAALTEATIDDELPDDLYKYFAQELYDAARQETREALLRLALVPTADAETVSRLFTGNRDEVLDDAARLGFFANVDRPELHPLLRAFLVDKVIAAPDGPTIVSAAAQVLLDTGHWDESFELFERTRVADPLIVQLIRGALNDMLTAGRFVTVARWVAFARAAEVADPVVDLAEAEVAFRQGALTRAEVLALQASAQLKDGDPLLAHALLVAGRAAHLSDRDDVALAHFTDGRNAAVNDRDAREGLWGQIIAAKELGADTAELRRELEAIAATNAADALRFANVQLVVATREGWIEEALDKYGAAEDLVDGIDDPMIRTSFLNGYARALALAAHYDHAASVARAEVDEAERCHLPFVLPHAFVAQAMAEAGRRQFRKALTALRHSEDAAATTDDIHSIFEVKAVRCRVLASRRAFDDALRETEPHDSRRPTGLMLAEYLASRSIALAGIGATSDARQLAERARGLTRAAEAQILATCALAVAATVAGTARAAKQAKDAFEAASRSGHIDSFVTAYRAAPDMLAIAWNCGISRDRLREVVSRAHDESLAESVGVKRLPGRVTSDPLRDLSKREREVYLLLARGLSNKEIAAKLYISEATTKVHVRHVLAKLGARSRTEAVLLGLPD